jgi:Flp pilus assembly protein TadG
MAKRSAKNRRRGRGDRGGVLVEAAIMLPFLFALVFGIIDFGFSFNDWISVRQGGRDGLRQALVNTNPSGAPSTCNVHGTVAAGDATAMMCYTKARVGLDNSKTYVKMLFNAPYKAGNPVKICVEYQTSSVTGAYSAMLNNKILDTQVESLIEQTASPTFAPFAETSPDSWANCGTL